MIQRVGSSKNPLINYSPASKNKFLLGKEPKCVLVRDRLNRIAAMMSAFCDEIAPISGVRLLCNPKRVFLKWSGKIGE